MATAEEPVTAYVLVKTDVGKADIVLNDILSLPQISKAVIVTGDYDIVIEITATNVQNLISKIVKDIHRIGNIKETKTLIGAKIKPYIPRANL
ncbi:MAG: Lrp/AsnC ligand binding domain-containing protein [Candidatus Thermoplasmatota archaeon]